MAPGLLLSPFPQLQAMDLSADVWGLVRGRMSLREWAKACGTSPASYTLRRSLVAAEVRNDPGKYGRLLVRLLQLNKGPNVYTWRLNLRQLQLKRWSTCHSLWLNLWQLHKAAEVTPAQVKHIQQAASTLPMLQCLHIIGRPEVPLTQSSVEGVLLSLLVRHAAVLTLRVMRVLMPLDFPTLQHLVLDVDSGAIYLSRGKGCVEVESKLFPAISMLKGLKTLYVQSSESFCTQGADLTGCVRLTHVALQRIELIHKLALPAGCLLHAHTGSVDNIDMTRWMAHSVTGLTARENPKATS